MPVTMYYALYALVVLIIDGLKDCAGLKTCARISILWSIMMFVHVRLLGSIYCAGPRHVHVLSTSIHMVYTQFT